MVAKYIICDGSVPFVVPAHIPMWDFYNGLVKAKLVGVATSCGRCYYDPTCGWVVFSDTSGGTSESTNSLCVVCRYGKDAKILNRHLCI
jgi:hypothetical protein